MSKFKCSLLSCEIDAATQAKLVPYYVEIPILFGFGLGLKFNPTNQKYVASAVRKGSAEQYTRFSIQWCLIA
jgi:hypothetical protein